MKTATIIAFPSNRPGRDPMPTRKRERLWACIYNRDASPATRIAACAVILRRGNATERAEAATLLPILADPESRSRYDNPC